MDKNNKCKYKLKKALLTELYDSLDSLHDEIIECLRVEKKKVKALVQKS